MIDIKQKFEEGYILGCIKHKEQCSLYLMPIAYWILNYKKYDPTYNPEDWEFVYRDNILIVSDENIDSYMKAIEIDKISPLELPRTEVANLNFYIDFDNKLFVSSFNDIEAEDYLPHDGWRGIYDNPLNYLSSQCNIL